jgi:hypothetical protein
MLTWPQVDPARHPFDPDGVAAVVYRLSPLDGMPQRPPGTLSNEAFKEFVVLVGGWSSGLTAGLVAHYGDWIDGWSHHITSGGPIHEWCCPNHTYTDPEAARDAVVAALIEWRFWLERLAMRFDRHLPLPADLPADEAHRAWQRAAARLVTMVVKQTRAYDMWYGHCETVLEWFLTAAGVPGDDHSGLVRDAIGGEFRSWGRPGGPVVVAVAGRLATAVTRPPDA